MAQTVKRLPTMQETWVRFLGWEDPLEKEIATHSSTLPGKSHEQRSLVGYSPQGHKESDMTERLHSLTLNSLRPRGLNSPGHNTGMGRLSLLQRIFLTQKSNRGLLHCRQILLSYQGSL